LFQYNWYAESYAQVRWENKLSTQFQITKGMKQGSKLSPGLFNIFINDLLLQLKSVNSGVKIQDFHINVLAYCDDLNLISTTATGLQKLIDICYQYAQMWRMRFNPLKTSIVCVGKQPHIKPPGPTFRVWESAGWTSWLKSTSNFFSAVPDYLNFLFVYDLY